MHAQSFAEMIKEANHLYNAMTSREHAKGLMPGEHLNFDVQVRGRVPLQGFELKWCLVATSLEGFSGTGHVRTWSLI